MNLTCQAVGDDNVLSGIEKDLTGGSQRNYLGYDTTPIRINLTLEF